MPSDCRRLGLAFLAGLLVIAGPAGAQFRPGARDAEQFRPIITLVTINVPPSAFDPATGTAVVTVPRAILGRLHAPHAWTLAARTALPAAIGRHSLDTKPSSDLAIRASGEPGFKPFSTTPVSVLSGSNTHGWIDVAFDLQLTVRLTDASGGYTYRVLFGFN